MTNPLDNPHADPFDIAAQAAQQIAVITGVKHHDIALTLGSGWGRTATLLGDTTCSIPATDIVGFHASAVPGHNSTISSVLLPNRKRALILGARTHHYEGHGVRHVVHSVRTAAATGATTLILTNGAGSINPDWAPGTPVLIRDHINLTGTSPLEGATFIDLTDLYTPALRELVHTVDPTLPEGVYVQFPGPHYETPAEIRMAATIGGDIAGMSTTLEAIAARQAGMNILGLSLITNHAAGTHPGQALSHDEVIAEGKAAEARLAALLTAIVHQL